MRRFLLAALLAAVALTTASAEQMMLLGVGRKAEAGGGGPSALFTSLVACWDQQEASGNALDSCPGGHDGTEQGSTLGTGAGPGGTDASRDYDDNFGEFFRIADHADLRPGDIDFCVETFVNLGSTTGFRGLVSKYGTGDLGFSLIYSGGAERFAFIVSNDGTATATITATAFGKPNTGQWYHLIGCHSATDNELRLYVDNTTVTPVSHSTGVFASTAPLELGARNGIVTLEGRQAYSRLYKNYMLTPDDRTFLYNGGAGRTRAEIEAYVP